MVETAARGRGRMWRVHLAWALCALAAVLATAWAVRIALTPPQAESAPSERVPTVTVGNGSIEQTQAVAASATYRPVGRGLAGVSGTLTTVSTPEDGVVRQGDVLATIDLKPVVVLEGDVPMFRDLRPGVTGADVAQLRSGLGLSEAEVFDAETEEAVRTWQGGLGLDETGEVLMGQVLFIPSLPAPALVTPELRIGDHVEPGQVLVEVFAAHPDVYVPAEAGGVQLAPGLSAHVADGSAGELTAAEPDEQGVPRFSLVDGQGRSVCTATCAEDVPAPGPSPLEVIVQVVTRAEGPTLPRAAILYAPDGTAQVQRVSGELVSVTVVQEASGQVVVRGVEAGDVVRLFPEDA